MKQSMNKTVIATAVAAALCAPAAFAGSIIIDRDGAGGSSTILVNTLNWAGTNMLMQNLIHSTTIAGVEVASRLGDFTLWAQGNLGGFGSTSPCAISGVCPVVNEWTYQVGVTMNIASDLVTGSDIHLTGGLALVPTINFFNIYYDPGNDALHLPGTGFGNGTLILSGTVTNAEGGTSIDIPMDHTDSNKAITATSQLRRLDNFGGADNRSTIGTYVSNGNTQLDINVTFQDTNFFVTPLTTLTVGLNLSTGGGVLPFSQVEPSASIVGNAPNYGLSTNTNTGVFRSSLFGPSTGSRLMDDLFCGVKAGGGSTTCDLHAQGQGLTAFFANATPEPGSLALLGLGLGALGFGARARRGRKGEPGRSA